MHAGQSQSQDAGFVKLQTQLKVEIIRLVKAELQNVIQCGYV